MVGIENLKKAILALINAGTKLEKILEDGKVKWYEAIGFVPELKGLAESFREWEEIKKEYSDLDAAERNDIVLFVADSLKLNNQRTEQIIEASFELIVALDKYRYVLRNTL
jgi:aspartate-semialdehyde dehydrogenase